MGPKQAFMVARLDDPLHEAPRGEAGVMGPNPWRLPPDSEPEPDPPVLAPPLDRPRGRHPEPPEVLLPIEVADLSLELDREAELPPYAEAGIPQVWPVKLKEGRYRPSRLLSPSEPASPLAFPEVSLPWARSP